MTERDHPSEWKQGDRVILDASGWAEKTGTTAILSVRDGGRWIATWNESVSVAIEDLGPRSASLFEPRKRLREYTDLADGDVVVIAGVDWEVEQNRHLAKLVRGALSVSALGDAFRDMFVDEVRRKPRMKKRRVYEEVLNAKCIAVDDIIVCDGEEVVAGYKDLNLPANSNRTVYRLIEETEVPR